MFWFQFPSCGFFVFQSLGEMVGGGAGGVVTGACQLKTAAIFKKETRSLLRMDCVF